MATSDRRVLIRADAGMGIGLGHLSRCLAVAHALVVRGIQVHVATRARGLDVLGRVEGTGCHLALLSDLEPVCGKDSMWAAGDQVADAEASLTAGGHEHWDAIIVDHYQLAARWEDVVHPCTERVVALDDLANRPHSADVVVDHNWYGRSNADRYAQLVAPDTLLLLGPRYAMLHPAYAAARLARGAPSTPPRTVVVSFGGTDVGRQSAPAVEALLDVPGIDIHVVLGTPHAMTPELQPLIENPRVSLHVGLPTMVDLLAQADLAIGAGGTATWERLCLDVPALVTTVNEGQSGVTRAFHQAGITTWLGTADQVRAGDYRHALTHIMSRSERLAWPLVDGLGAARVGLAAMPDCSMPVHERPAGASDLPAFVTSGPGSDQHPAAWHARAQEFRQRLGQGGMRTLEQAGVSVGFRWDVDGLPHQWVDPVLGHVATKGIAS